MTVAKGDSPSVRVDGGPLSLYFDTYSNDTEG